MSEMSGSPFRAIAMALDAFVRRAVDLCLIVSCVTVLLMAVYGSTDVLSTFLLGRPVPLARELSEVLLAVAIFSAMATALREDRNVSVDLFISRAGPRVRKLARGMALIVGGVVFAILAWRGGIMAHDAYADNELATALIRFQIWPFKAAVAFAIAVTLAEYVRLFIRLLIGRDPILDHPLTGV